MNEPPIEDRIAQRKAAEAEFRERLAGNYFDGPHEIPTGGGFDPLSAMFGGGPFRYAICLVCGAMIRLDDPEERGGVTVERGLGKHMAFHRMHDDYDGDLVTTPWEG